MPSGGKVGGVSGKMPMPKAARKIIFGKIKELRVGYQLLFLIVISFAVISFWRGAWGLMDEFYAVILPSDPRFGFWASFIVGLLILMATGYASRELV